MLSAIVPLQRNNRSASRLSSRAHVSVPCQRPTDDHASARPPHHVDDGRAQCPPYYPLVHRRTRPYWVVFSRSQRRRATRSRNGPRTAGLAPRHVVARRRGRVADVRGDGRPGRRHPGHIPDDGAEPLPRRPAARPRAAGPRPPGAGHHELPGCPAPGQPVAHRHRRTQAALGPRRRLLLRRVQNDVSRVRHRGRVRARPRPSAGGRPVAVRPCVRPGDRRVLHHHADVRADRRRRKRPDRRLLPDDHVPVRPPAHRRADRPVVHAGRFQRLLRPLVVARPPVRQRRRHRGHRRPTEVDVRVADPADQPPSLRRGDDGRSVVDSRVVGQRQRGADEQLSRSVYDLAASAQHRRSRRHSRTGRETTAASTFTRTHTHARARSRARYRDGGNRGGRTSGHPRPKRRWWKRKFLSLRKVSPFV